MTYTTPMKSMPPEDVVKVLRDRRSFKTALAYVLRTSTTKDSSRFLAILNAGFDLTSRDLDGRNVLHHITRAGTLEVLDAVLQRFPKEHIDRPNHRGNTPLIIAAGRGDAAMVGRLLTAGAAPNPDVLSNFNENTALHIAAQQWHGPVVELLLDAGGQVQRRNKKGEDAFSYALDVRPCTPVDQVRQMAVLQSLAKAGADILDLDLARSNAHKAIAGPSSTMAFLLSHGAPVDRRDTEGNTVLMALCALFGLSETERQQARRNATLLIKAGADVTLVNNEGDTALHMVILHNDPSLIRELVQAGADPFARNAAGETPLEKASSYPNLEGSVLALTLAEVNPSEPMVQRAVRARL